ncbi:EAL domain-containing protein [Paraglaciecola polaris]|uniref:EAL domain-containing protein n=1 Tax=Paraglaciecola polaris TaxID=222814 RepID=UPI0030EDAF01|tara:strand:+ start:6193 stop:10671 length:4479 start_codon:yes stop_codon:yes gene_type:complete
MWLVTATLGFSYLAHGQSFSFDNLTKADGLAQNTVIDTVEDSRGFMWFATANGLSRFDGYEFVNYQNNPNDINSLPHDFVRTLLVDKKGVLWVGTQNGLASYNAQADNFTRYNQQNSGLDGNIIYALNTTPEGILLVASEISLFTYSPNSNDFTQVDILTNRLPPEVKSILAEEELTWIGTYGHGIYVLDNQTKTLYDLKKNNPLNVLISAEYLFDIKRYGENYWFATELGAYVWNINTKELRHFNTDTSPNLIGNGVRSIQLDIAGNIWLGTSVGLTIINKGLNSTKHVSLEGGIGNSAQQSDAGIFLLNIYRDRNDTLWLGSHTAGVYRYNQDSALFRHYIANPSNVNALSGDVVWSIKQDSKGMVWLATQSGGVSEFDPQTESFTSWLKGFEHSIWDLAIDEQDRLWLATSGGVFVYQKTNENKLIRVTALFKDTFYGRILYDNQRMWLKSSNNVLHWVDTKDFSEHFIRLEDTTLKTLDPIFVDSKNKLWIRANNGLIHFDLNTQEMSRPSKNPLVNGNNFSSIIETKNGFWLASIEFGLIELDKLNYQLIKKININSGLYDNQITKALRVDNSIWLTTMAGGIEEVSISTGEVVQQISPERLNFNDFNEGSGLVTANKFVLFGGTKGIHLFEHQQVTLNDDSYQQVDNFYKKNPPILTHLRLFNQEVTVHSIGSPLQKPIYLTDELTLPNNSNHVSLTFGRLNPLDARGYTYRYRLGGYSNKWLDADIRTREATFTNLDFGQYQFEVQSRHNMNPWSDSAKLTLNIEPPLWLHRNALVLYCILILFIGLTVVKQYRSKRLARLAITESEERLKLTLWSSGDELWDWDIYQGQVFRSNTWGIMDFPQDDIRVNSAYQANIHQNDLKRVQDAMNEHLQDKTEHFEVTYRASTFKGEWLWVLDRGKVVSRDSNNQPLRMTGTFKNISHLKIAEEQLKLFKRSIETISDGVFIADTSFRYISVNKAYCKYTGETRDQALASYLTFHQYPGAFTEEVKKSLRQKGNWNGEVESRRINGQKYEMELNIDAINDEDGRISHYVGVFSDITSRKSTEKELLKLANTDPLTDLPNRSFFQASHNNIVRRGTQHALICLDMDNFKKINDSLGHQTGDMLIKQIAKRLQKLAGKSATCYRLGGDEFSILLDKDTDVHSVTHFTQSILDDMARPFLINHQEFVLGASVGIAFYPEDGSSPQELLKNADTAMYFAKNAGGNKYQFFSGEMNQNAVRQLQIENLIRHGLKEDLFNVYYQPKIDIATGKLVSMEALVRFEHPEKGIVSPAQFIPLAEQTGQVIDIGEVVLRKACEDTKRWVSAGIFTGRVAVNISARQFELPDLDEIIGSILQKADLSPLHLECEITEGTLMQDPDNALRMMTRLRERGIHLALDDFGTGYSSLAYLKRFPLNTLKIDKAFIDDIATSSVDRHMTAAIIDIAHNLGLKVVAEGVEHEEQMSILRRYECEMLQGYLYSKPLSSARFERLLKENHQLNRLLQGS